ncbi:MAG: M20 family metallopeptidase [Gemmataceae bacterium]|nr:M20 family metallopeptidase [Gemmataceae bacterium]
MPTALPPLPELLAELVRRPSVNPMGRTDLPAEILYEHRVTDYVASLLQGLECSVYRQPVQTGRENLLACYEPPGPVPCHLLFEVHQDTVPVDGMTIEPFAAHRQGNRLYGRGACDVKAGLAVMITAFVRLVRERPRGSARVTLACTVDEEHSFLGVQALVRQGFPQGRPQAAIVAEPTRLNIVHAHKGVVRWTLETSGRACHSSRPEQGVNAIYRMARILHALEQYAEHLRQLPADPLLGPRTLAVGRIQGGVSPNTIPDACRIDIDRRLLPGETAATAEAELLDMLRQAPGIDFPFTLRLSHAPCPPLSPQGSAPLVHHFGRVIDSVVGQHTVQAVPFGTDAATLALAGIPAIVFGPGDIAQAHTHDEWIDLDQLAPAAEILYRFAATAEPLDSQLGRS